MSALTHGHCRDHGKTPVYQAWLAMLERCKPTYSRAHDYVERGISVCERWRSFENFLEDMGECPEGLTLDRIDNDNGYEPGNCRWATRKQQQRNRRNNRIVTYRDEEMCLQDAIELSGVNYHTVRTRLGRGWSVERALSC